MLFEPVPLGPFDLDARIGQGGMGEVWRGIHREQRIAVAVKVILPAKAHLSGMLTSFRNEVRQVARLDHPAIVHVLDYGEIDERAERASEGRLQAGSPYWVMEYASGGSLDVHRRDLTWRQVREALEVVLRALAHAHSRGVIHRDVKPANVLVSTAVDPRPGLKLTDFGLAPGEDGPIHAADEPVGTPAYMAPEQARGRWREQGPWTDLYAVGCVAWELVTGNPPFLGRTWPAVLLAQIQAPLPPLVPRLGIPNEFEAWVTRLLAKAPRDRTRHAADALADLGDLGEVVDDDRARLRAAIAADTTSMFPRDAATAPPIVAHRGDAASVDTRSADGARVAGSAPSRSTLPHSPVSWREGPVATGSTVLRGAGLGLWGLRTVPLVDREEERRALWGELADVASTRRPRLVVLEGSAGQGKSRLASWLAERSSELGAAHALRAAHGPIPGPGHGLVRMVARALRCVGLEGRALRDQVRTAWEVYGGDDPEGCEALVRWLTIPVEASPVVEPPAQRHAVLSRFLARMGRERPIVAVLDDAQWGLDALDFARHVLGPAAPRDLPLLLVATCRDDALLERPGEAGMLAELGRCAGVARVRLGRLPERDTLALVEGLLGLTGPLADAVERRSGGNPLFAVQLVGDWVQRGVIEFGEAGFTLRSGESATLPDDIYDLWRTRLDRAAPADEASRTCLGVAAALGQEVDHPEWVAACAHLRIRPPEGLAESLLAHGLALARDGGWAFAHGMLREAIQRDADASGSWRTVNLACASMLRDRPAAWHVAERLGRHLVAAKEWGASLGPLLDGALEALEASDYVAAQELLDLFQGASGQARMTELDPRTGAASVARVRLMVGRGEFSEAGALAARTAERARRARWPDVQVQATRYRGVIAQKLGDLQAAEALLGQARALSERYGDPREQARCDVHLGTVLRLRGDLDGAMRALDRARDAFETLGEPLGVADSLAEMGGALVSVEGQRVRAETLIRDALDRYRKLGRSVGIAHCGNTLGDILRAGGDLDGAAAAYRDSEERFERAGSHARVFPLFNLGLVLLSQDLPDDALAKFSDALDLAERTGRRAMPAGCHLALLVADAVRGRFGAAAEHLSEADRLLLESGTADADLAALAGRAAFLASAAGLGDVARSAFRLALTQYEAIGDELGARRALAGLDGLDSEAG